MNYLKKSGIALGLAVACVFGAIAIFLGIIHITNFIYHIDINALDIVENSGYDREVIVDNVDAVLDYLNPFCFSDFDLPDLEYSQSGASHFRDCKVVFNGFYILGFLSVCAVVLIMIFVKPDKFTLKLSACLTLAIPTAVGIAMALNFEKTFVIFHKLLFNNSDWIFDPRTDPIILLLPAEFFMHCGIFIALGVVLAALILFLKGILKNEEL